MYINAADVLPKDLLNEVQKYVKSGLIYIPEEQKKGWGLESGTKSFYERRNQEIRDKYQAGSSFDSLSTQYGLAYNTIRKIVYQN